MADESIDDQIITKLVEKLVDGFPLAKSRQKELRDELIKNELDFQAILEILANADANRD